jgi:TonB family protein
MTAAVIYLASISVKAAFLGAMVFLQLYLLRRAPASSRSRLCAAALLAILLLGAVEWLAPAWTVKAQIFSFTADAQPALRTVASTSSVPWGTWIMFLWAAGATIMLVRALAGRAVLASVRRRSTLLDRVAGIEVRIADVQTPILCGVLRPAILLPAAAQSWNGLQRSMALTHELTHHRNRDAWTNLLAQFVRAALWFHPVAWILASRLSREQELACDEAVVASGHSTHEYAAFLLDEVRNLKSRDLFACAMAGSGAQSLKQRFANLLDTRPRPRLSRRIAMSLASFALVAMALAVVRPGWSQSVRDDRDNGKKDEKVHKVGNGVIQPKVLHKVDPEYTAEDKAAGIEGPVILKGVVSAEGKFVNAVVIRSLTPGLDGKAMEAIEKWVFQPGTKDGQAVNVWATIEVNFRLK